MVPPTDPWYEDLTGLYPYDPQKARRLLAQAGRPKLTLQFRIPNLPYAVSAAEVVKSQLDQVGITANIDVLEFPARWLDVVFKKADYDMSLISHVEARDIATFADPTYYWRYDNPRVRELLAAAETGDKRAEIDNMKQLARTIAEDAAADWLFLLPNIMVADKNVAGLPKNLVGEALDLTALSRS
jgi:peptide/nickel transport system substrate-binding protein